MRWKVRKSEEVYKSQVFRLRKDQCELPDGRVMPRYFVMEFPDWVNVVPVTEEKNVIMVRQYRHAGDGIYLEIPGGSTHGPSEDPRVAGERELREETGYQAQKWIYCGWLSPNPALQNNKIHTFLALGCQRVGEPQLDPYEDLTVEILPLEKLLQIWRDGGIKHSLIYGAIGLALPHIRTSLHVFL
ncbi:MAG: hypothetical protein C5B49_08520 [Bdellovibrio sp.]|nr:MAG: hypothetical protein C5B49_08520 [Bdellovibrio sp.]